MTENETRAAGGSIEARRSKRADGTDARVIGGSAIVYNSPSRDLGGFVEYIDPGSVLTTDWTNALLNHDQHFLLGTLRAGTLRLTDSRTSLDYEVDVPDHRTDVYELVARGDIRDSSFAFSSREETWDWDSEDYAVRRVHQLDLYDVSAVQVGAYPAASSNTRALAGLAAQVGASLEEVQARASAGELRSFFKRSDTTVPTKPVTYYAGRLKELGIG